MWYSFLGDDVISRKYIKLQTFTKSTIIPTELHRCYQELNYEAINSTKLKQIATGAAKNWNCEFAVIVNQFTRINLLMLDDE